ncbi:beta-ketoacyl-ACP synthase III [Neisseriaceae bacterium PsAf]|nr:beta-ketoacyl-ACP synthase III [Neisseriaceae bacterium PsAf]MCV2502766.1 beta-ketoacyl-ACP synthase III [Neisseriaceae bacterium]
MDSKSVILVSTGLCVPPYSVSNDELVECFNQYVNEFNQAHQAEIEKGEIEALRESSSEFIVKASGIESRYFFAIDGVLDPKRMVPYIPERSNDEISLQAEKGVEACKDALKRANLEPSDIDMVVLACSNMQRPYPAVSVEIQKELGIEGFAYDMNVACSSATFGLFNAYNAIQSGNVRAALIVNVEICCGHLNFRDRDSHFIFGDVATAFILQREDLVKDKHQGFKVLGTSLFTDFSSAIRNNFGFLNRCDIEKRDDPDKLFIQQGRKVFKEVCPRVGKHITEHLENLSIKPEEVKRFWLHQANLSMNQLITKKVLGRHATEEEAPVILDEFANTSSAGCIIALHQYQDGLKPGDYGVISSFGAGYSVGSVIVEKR